jgi:hypothetical protein
LDLPVTTSPRSFAITWDYRCPFARNAHEHVTTALRAGAAWDVRFVAFSLGQVHVTEDEPDIWERPEDDTGLLALQAGVVVRDRVPERFLDVHDALFALRHDHGGHLRDEAAVRAVLTEVGVDAAGVFEQIATGDPLLTVRQEHEWAVKEHHVFGVPTFIAEGRAAFVRLMDRPSGDADRASQAIDGVLDLLLDDPQLNEFKHTSIPR